VPLRAQNLAVLRCLAQNAGHVVSKDRLMQAVWPGIVVTDDSLFQCIKELRRALGDTGHRLIETAPKQGYRLVPSRSNGPPPADEPFEQEIHFARSANGVRIAYAVSGRGPVTIVRAAHWMTHLEWDWRSPVYGPGIQRSGEARPRRITSIRICDRNRRLSMHRRSLPASSLITAFARPTLAETWKSVSASGNCHTRNHR
jgi:hypothetical protein